MSVFVVRVVSHLFAECVNVNYFYLSFTIIAAFSLLSLKSSSQLRGDLCKSGPGHFASEKGFPSNFTQ